MYRKYGLKRTHVINSHNYLLEAEDKDGNPCFFHQILISSQSLPSLKDHTAIEQIIGESENQNVVNEIRGNFQFYLQQNLLQIMLKQGVKPINQIGRLPVRQALKLVNTLNLDLVISIKQLRSINRQSQVSYSNSNKFFSQFILKAKQYQLICPFIDAEQIHFYDFYYQEAFCKNRQKEKQKKIDEQVLKKKISQKRIKRKSQLLAEDPFNTDQIVFRKYVQLLVLLFSDTNIIEFIQDLHKVGSYSTQETLKKIQKIQDNTTDKAQKLLMDLLQKCIANESQYNLNIFVKQCEILIDKHNKIQKGVPSQKRIDQPKVTREEKTKNSKSCLALNKELRAELFMPTNNDRINTRQSEKRLKGSKSLINLKVNRPGTSSKSKVFKVCNSLFSKSKEKLSDKTNIFQQSWSSFTKQKNINNSSFGVSQPSSFGMAVTADSNWFSESVNNNQSIIKLRNFKKTNNFTNTGTHKPSHNQFRTQVSAEIPQNQICAQDADKVGEFQQNRLNKMMKKNSFRKIDKPAIQQDDKFTMTEFSQEQKKEEPQQQRKIDVKQQKIEKSCFRREIVNTINLKFHQASNKMIEVDKNVEIKHKKIQQVPTIVQKQVNKQQKIQLIPTSQIKQKNLNDNQEPTKPVSKQSIKPKNKQQIKKPVIDNQQFQEVTFNKKQISKKMQNTSIFMNRSNIIYKKEEQLKSLVQVQPKPKQNLTKIIIKPLPEDQKKLYVNQYILLLKFYKQNCSLKQAKLAMLPYRDNLFFVIYFLYCKTLAENQNSNNEGFKKIVDLISKKQQKISNSERQAYLLYRVECDSLPSKMKSIFGVESSLIRGIDEDVIKQKIKDAKQQIQQLYTLSCQSNRILESIYKEISAYVLTNKIMLINKDAFIPALQLLYLINHTMIISVQRQKYYKFMLDSMFAEMNDCFRFRYEKSEEEYLRQYKKKIESIDKVSISVQEECAFFQRQYDKYK